MMPMVGLLICDEKMFAILKALFGSIEFLRNQL
jgi:hypothetical protein